MPRSYSLAMTYHRSGNTQSVPAPDFRSLLVPPLDAMQAHLELH